MIKCDNLSFFLNRNNYGGSSFPNQFVWNVKTSHFDESHQFAKDVMPSSGMIEDPNGEQNLHHMNDEESAPLFFGSLNDGSPTMGVSSNNGVPLLSIPNNAQADLDTPFNRIIPNINVNVGENALTNVGPHPFAYPPEVLNPNDGSYFAPDRVAQNDEAGLYNQHGCTNLAIQAPTDHFNPTLMSTNQNSSESIAHVNSLSDVGNYGQTNDYDAYQ